ncbi:MAG: hypothetical protein IAE99_06600 [Rhodothermales bacterium]|nr:hypothetical protein [Rhodothermales bacterium]
MTLPDAPSLLLVAKASAVLAAAAALAFALRRRAAARPHAVWTTAFAALLLLPAAATVAPAWYAGWFAAPAERPAAADATPAPRLDRLPALPGLQTAPARPADDAAPVPVVPLAYGLGVLGVMGYGLLGMLRLRRWRYASLPDAALTAEASALAATLGVRRPVVVRTAPGLPTPMTWGVRRPLVLMPADAVRWMDERRRVVFLHELAHVARYDALTQTLAFVGCAALWFHPLAWWGAHAMRTTRERACDDLVLASGTRPSAYAAHLVALARTLRPRAVPAFAAAVVRTSELETRVRAILAPNQQRGHLGRGRVALTMVVAALTTVGLAAFQPWTHPARTNAPAVFAPTPAQPSLQPSVSAAAASLPTDPVRARYAVRPGGTLTLDADVGSIEVQTGSSDAVEVTVERTFDVRLEGRRHGADATVRVRMADPQRRWQRGDRVRTKVRVPARYSAHVSTAGGSVTVARLDGGVTARTAGGSVTIGGATGDVQAATAGGSVTAGRVGGRLAVETAGGSIRLDGGAGGAVSARTSGGSVSAIIRHRLAAPVTLETLGGAVTITLPAGVNASLDAEAQGGGISSDFGPVRGNRLRTPLGGGGPTVRVRTMGGSVAIRRGERALAPTTRLSPAAEHTASLAAVWPIAERLHGPMAPQDDATGVPNATPSVQTLAPVAVPLAVAAKPAPALRVPPRPLAAVVPTDHVVTNAHATGAPAVLPSDLPSPTVRVRTGMSLSGDTTDVDDVLPEPSPPSSVLRDFNGSAP